MKYNKKEQGTISFSKVEIWCGQSEGQMAVFSLTDSVVTNQDIVSHNLELGQVVSYASKNALNILDTKTNLI